MEEEYAQMVNEYMSDYYEDSLDGIENNNSDTEILSESEIEACFLPASQSSPAVDIHLELDLLRNGNHISGEE